MFDANSIPAILDAARAAAKDDVATARLGISLLDLTSLNDDDTQDVIRDLCARAQSPAGNTAAVCVYSQFIETAWRALGASGIKTATVVNFPQGGTNAQRVADETADAVARGTDEVDLVLPYQAFLAGDMQAVTDVIDAVRFASGPMTTLKIILESGAFDDLGQLYDASRLAIRRGANFIKTSTGKIATGATPEAAATMISAICDAREEDGMACGFKASGGIRTTMDVALYLAIADDIMGEGWASPDTFRFGASGVLSALLESCGMAAPATTAGGASGGTGNY